MCFFFCSFSLVLCTITCNFAFLTPYSYLIPSFLCVPYTSSKFVGLVVKHNGIHLYIYSYCKQCYTLKNHHSKLKTIILNWIISSWLIKFIFEFLRSPYYHILASAYPFYCEKNLVWYSYNFLLPYITEEYIVITFMFKLYFYYFVVDKLPPLINIVWNF